MNNFENINQTQFALEEPILSDVNVDLVPEEEPDKQDSKNKKPAHGKKIIVIIGVVVILIFFALLILVIKSRKKPEVEVVDEQPTEVIEDLGPFKERIKNARLDLDVADPANQDLTFPPVNMNLRLDEKEK